MKKLVLLIAALTLFAVACASNTTIDTGTDGLDASTPEANEPTAVPDTEPQAADQATDTVDDDGEERESGVQATDPTPVPEPTEPVAEQEPTAVPAEEPTSAPVGPAPGQAEAIQAVADADDWCQAAQAVETGLDDFETLNFSDPVELEQGVRQSLAVVDASRRLVPAEIAADVDQTVEGFTAFATALEEANWSFIDLDLSILDTLDGPMTLAAYNIELYNFNECGIGSDPGTPPVIADDGTVEDDGLDTLPEFDGTIRDQAVQGLVEAGFTADEANCILEDLDFTDPAALSDPAALLTVFTDCGISLDRLAQLGG